MCPHLGGAMELVRGLFAGIGGIVWTIAGPITYIVLVVDTWSSYRSVVTKILIALTLDAFLAMIWPITWALWIISHLMGGETPISTVLGF